MASPNGLSWAVSCAALAASRSAIFCSSIYTGSHLSRSACASRSACFHAHRLLLGDSASAEFRIRLQHLPRRKRPISILAGHGGKAKGAQCAGKRIGHLGGQRRFAQGEMSRIQLAIVHAPEEDARSEVAHVVDIQQVVGSEGVLRSKHILFDAGIATDCIDSAASLTDVRQALQRVPGNRQNVAIGSESIFELRLDLDSVGGRSSPRRR